MSSLDISRRGLVLHDVDTRTKKKAIEGFIMKYLPNTFHNIIRGRPYREYSDR